MSQGAGVPTDRPRWQRPRLLVSPWSQFVSSPEEKFVATTAARAAAFLVLAGRLVAGFSELARSNGASLVGAQNARDNIPPSQTLRARTPNRTGSLPPFAAQFFATPGAPLEITLQTSTSLYRLALKGYVETVRGATVVIAPATSSLGVTGAVAKSADPVPDRSACTVVAPPPDALQGIPHKGTESVSPRRRSPSR